MTMGYSTRTIDRAVLECLRRLDVIPPHEEVVGVEIHRHEGADVGGDLYFYAFKTEVVRSSNPGVDDEQQTAERDEFARAYRMLEARELVLKAGDAQRKREQDAADLAEREAAAAQPAPEPVVPMRPVRNAMDELAAMPQGSDTAAAVAAVYAALGVDPPGPPLVAEAVDPEPTPEPKTPPGPSEVKAVGGRRSGPRTVPEQTTPPDAEQ